MSLDILQNYPVSKVICFFQTVGDMNCELSQKQLESVFSKDFSMIAHGKKVCDFNGLLIHFDHIRKQVGKTKVVVNESVLTVEKQVLRYDLVSEKKGVGHVIAIFKYRPGEDVAYEMNEVFSLESGDLDMSK